MNATSTACTVCHDSNLKTVIDFGLHPPANRFMPADFSEHEQSKHPLALGYCEQCGTAQLTKRMPIEMMRPRYPWLLYNEPESHLDQIAEQLVTLPRINSASRILGVTYKDQSTVDRLAKLGLSNGVCIADTDFNSSADFFGLETIQHLLREPALIQNIKAKYGAADILLMRHVIEHSEDAAALIHALRELITDDGYLVMELPDSEKILKSGNHAFIWEEHISYFTEQTLGVLAQATGAELAWFQRCSYPYEDSLLAAFRFPSLPVERTLPEFELFDTSTLLDEFKYGLVHAKDLWRKKLVEHQANGERVAVFGAGHLAAKFINFLDLADVIHCVIDDNPNKVGMKMPGSGLPIMQSKDMAHEKIKVCISTLSPESDAKVRLNLESYFVDGGQFIPAFKVAEDPS
ncbi:MAG: methyltransferase domain-containing protein [Legionellaceae bacterium]|nr:methyltransferase domain-containing protein [Legionellaceae bacterium]MBP9774372.1 methyltransferase domain-containing protein [Legionellaceae bacterium]